MTGAILAMVAEACPPKPTFKVEDMPDLTGKVVIVTGANTGVGKETAKALLAHNAKVYLAARSPEKANKAIHDLKSETGKEAIYLKLDLGDLKSVKAAAEEFLSKEQVLHVLFNNANPETSGVMAPPIADVSAQGYDLQFGTNVLGHFYFTKLLLLALLNAAKSSANWKARVVTTSSSASYIGKLKFNTLKDGPDRQREGTMDLYGQSKLGNVLVSNQFAKLYGDQGIVSMAVNPGNLDSELGRHFNKFQAALVRRMVYPVPYGALTQLYAGTMDEGAQLNGKWLKPWARIGEHPNRLTRDEQLAEDLWKWCEDQVADL